MAKFIFKVSLLLVVLIGNSLQGPLSFEKSSHNLSAKPIKTQELPKSLKITPDWGNIPLNFIPNYGQVDEEVLYYAKTPSYTLWLTREGFVLDKILRKRCRRDQQRYPYFKSNENPKDLDSRRVVSRYNFLGTRLDPDVVPFDQTEHRVNYFVGSETSKWYTDIQTSKSVLYKDLYKNIDLKFYGTEGQIEYDFIVKPDGLISDIKFEIEDIHVARIDSAGDLIVHMELNELIHAKPLCYQIIKGSKVPVEAQFAEITKNVYGFEIKDCDTNLELIIDPLIKDYSTFLGSWGAESGFGIAVDSEGAAYITGITEYGDFPTQDPLQANNAGGRDVFVTKINADGDAIEYSTYLGGAGNEEGEGIAVDIDGNVYITGTTVSSDFPTQDPFQPNSGGDEDVFVTKLNPTGDALIFSTYLGGSRDDWSYGGIAVDSENAVYLTGATDSSNFPLLNPILGQYQWSVDAFVTKFEASGTNLVYSTYLGGWWYDTGEDIAVDSEGAAYITGSFGDGDYSHGHPQVVGIAKINPGGDALDYFFKWGGSYDMRWGSAIAIDPQGAAYVVGTDLWWWPYYEEFDEQGYNAFVIKVNPAGDELLYSVNFNASDDDFGEDIVIDPHGAVYVIGTTESVDFPTHNPIQLNKAGGSDVFVVKLKPPDTTPVVATFFGGSNDDEGNGLAVDSIGRIYMTGRTSSSNFPISYPRFLDYGGWDDAFVTRLQRDPLPDIKADGSDTAISITRSDSLTLSISILVGSETHGAADWGLFADSPFGWYYYDETLGWLPGQEAHTTLAIQDFPPFDVVIDPGLPAGSYTFYFGVDLEPNGRISFDSLEYDRVRVNITQ